MIARLRAIVSGVLLAGAALLLAGAPASAHALLQVSYPTDGDVLDTLPARVSLAFYEPIAPPAYVAVTAPDGSELAAGAAVIDGLLVSQALQPSGQVGTYLLAYSAVSADGHPITGSLAFTVGHINTLTNRDPATPAATATRTTAGPANATGAAGLLPAATTGQPNALVGLGLVGLAVVLYALSRITVRR